MECLGPQHFCCNENFCLKTPKIFLYASDFAKRVELSFMIFLFWTRFDQRHCGDRPLGGPNNTKSAFLTHKTPQPANFFLENAIESELGGFSKVSKVSKNGRIGVQIVIWSKFFKIIQYESILERKTWNIWQTFRKSNEILADFSKNIGSHKAPHLENFQKDFLKNEIKH